MHVWLGLALFSLFNNQKSTSKAAKPPTGNLLIVLKTFLQTLQLALAYQVPTGYHRLVSPLSNSLSAYR